MFISTREDINRFLIKNNVIHIKEFNDYRKTNSFKILKNELKLYF